jgi:hypothetical protein
MVTSSIELKITRRRNGMQIQHGDVLLGTTLKWLVDSIWLPVLGIIIGCALAVWILFKTQELVAHYQIEPIVAFCALNALGILAVYLGIKAKNWASRRYDLAVTTPKAVTNPPISVSPIAQAKLPFRKFNHFIPMSTQSPPHPSQAQMTMAIPKGNIIQPIRLSPGIIRQFMPIQSRKLIRRKVRKTRQTRVSRPTYQTLTTLRMK